jgi:hypothetical protein
LNGGQSILSLDAILSTLLSTLLKDISCHPCALTDLFILYMLRTHHGLPHHERGTYERRTTHNHALTHARAAA